MYIFQTDITFLFFSAFLLLTIIILLTSFWNDKFLDFILSFLTLLIYLIFVISKNGLGVDEPVYLRDFESYISNGDIYSNNILYSLKFLYGLLSYMGIEGGSFNAMVNAVLGVLSFALVYLIVKGNNKAICLVVFIFSYVTIDMFFNAYKQAFSVIFLVASIYFYDNKKKALFLLAAFVAIGFHWSVIIIYFLFFVSKRFNWLASKSIILFCLCAIIVTFFIKIGIIDLIYKIFDSFPYEFMFKGKILAYLKADTGTTYYDLNYNGRLPLFITNLTSLLIMLLFYDKVKLYKNLPFINTLFIFSIFLIEMSYSFRNFYWVIPFTFILMNFVLNSSGKKRFRYYLYFSFIFLSLQLPMLFSSGLIPMLF